MNDASQARARFLRASLTLLLVAGTLSGLEPAGREAHAASRPNVIVFLTDDQRYDTLWSMPNVRSLLADHGVTFPNAIVSNSLCCPSRSAILTGSYAHTNGVWRNVPPYGGWASFDDSGTIATQLQAAGYRTGLFGKYLNGYWDGAAVGYEPPGWDRWFAFSHAGFYDYDVLDDGTLAHFGGAADDYSTHVLTRAVTSFIGQPSSDPFFAYVAPFAPHRPAIGAPGDWTIFRDRALPTPPNFNEDDVSDKPTWIRDLPTIGRNRVEKVQDAYRAHMRSLVDVDRSLGDIVAALEAAGSLQDTVIVFLSDNGLAFGEHRWISKRVPYEESIRIPMIVRYDRLTVGGTTAGELVGNIDVAPTILDLAGVPPDPVMDGLSLAPLLGAYGTFGPRDGILLEHLARDRFDKVPTYCGVRTSGELFVRYVTGEEEYYDLATDPYELDNRASEGRFSNRLRELRTLAVACQPPEGSFSWG